MIRDPADLAMEAADGRDGRFSPSMHWPDPVTTHAIEPDRGPVLVTVEYHIDPKNREPFLHAIASSARERRRDGAYDWGIYEDPAAGGRFIETFLTDSWLEHLRQHERVTKADRDVEGRAPLSNRRRTQNDASDRRTAARLSRKTPNERQTEARERGAAHAPRN